MASSILALTACGSGTVGGGGNVNTDESANQEMFKNIGIGVTGEHLSNYIESLHQYTLKNSSGGSQQLKSSGHIAMPLLDLMSDGLSGFGVGIVGSIFSSIVENGIQDQLDAIQNEILSINGQLVSDQIQINDLTDELQVTSLQETKDNFSSNVKIFNNNYDSINGSYKNLAGKLNDSTASTIGLPSSPYPSEPLNNLVSLQDQVQDISGTLNSSSLVINSGSSITSSYDQMLSSLKLFLLQAVPNSTNPYSDQNKFTKLIADYNSLVEYYYAKSLVGLQQAYAMEQAYNLSLYNYNVNGYGQASNENTSENPKAIYQSLPSISNDNDRNQALANLEFAQQNLSLMYAQRAEVLLKTTMKYIVSDPAVSTGVPTSGGSVTQKITNCPITGGCDVFQAYEALSNMNYFTYQIAPANIANNTKPYYGQAVFYPLSIQQFLNMASSTSEFFSNPMGGTGRLPLVMNPNAGNSALTAGAVFYQESSLTYPGFSLNKNIYSHNPSGLWGENNKGSYNGNLYTNLMLDFTSDKLTPMAIPFAELCDVSGNISSTPDNYTYGGGLSCTIPISKNSSNANNYWG